MDLPLYTTVSRTELSDLGSADYHLFDKAIVLDQVMRQAGVDTEQQLFRDLLLRLRDGQTTVEDWKHLMKQTPAVVGATTPFAEALHLFATASDVAEHNIHKLHASGQPVAMLKAVHNGPGAFKATSEEAGGLDPVICIAQDAKVMLCANLWVDVGLVNGARGTIVAICYENGHSPPDLPVAVMVRFDCYSGPTLSDGSVPICPLRRTWFASNNQCSRLQVPLKLAWAVTIHKSQGMTLDKAVIDVGRKEFSSGLTVVACSRVRHMCDLLFVPPFPFQRVANLSKSNRLKDRLQEDVRLSCLTSTMPVHDSNITTTLSSGPFPSLNTTEHPNSTTASSITEIPIGQQAIGQEQQQPAFIPNNAPEVPNDGAASVPKSSDCANNCAFFIPNNAPEVPNDGAATDSKSSDCANECAVPHIQAAGDEEVMIVPSSGSFTCPFQYNPVDREWQQETCEAMGLNYITSNGITPGGREVGLEPPTTFTCIVGDGNCLFRALAHIITGSEERHMDVRRGIVSHMRTIGNLLVGGHVREGDIDTYIDSSRIEHDHEWGTDVEILTLAHMLKTPVYTYHEDTKSWNRYSPNAVERSLDESNISERGMYIRLARSHFDVVSSVNNQ